MQGGGAPSLSVKRAHGRRIRHARSLIEDNADGPYPFDQSFAPDAQTAHSMNNGHEFHAARSTPQKCAHGPQTGRRSGKEHLSAEDFARERFSHGAGILDNADLSGMVHEPTVRVLASIVAPIAGADPSSAVWSRGLT